MRLKTVLITIGVTSIILLIVMFVYFNKADLNKTDVYKFQLEIFRTIFIGALVSVLIILMPYLIKDRSYEFEMNKKAKEAYANAITGLNYLNIKLSYCKTVEEAFKYIEELNYKKQVAETCYHYLDINNKEAQNKQQRIWPSGLNPGSILEETKIKLQKAADNWGSWSEKKKLDYFNS